jgi:hypothetical protein
LTLFLPHRFASLFSHSALDFSLAKGCFDARQNRREKAQKSQNETPESTGFRDEESSAVADALVDRECTPHPVIFFAPLALFRGSLFVFYLAALSVKWFRAVHCGGHRPRPG